MGRIGLVVEGGGMKCAYSAGILDRFLDEGITFDYCVGVCHFFSMALCSYFISLTFYFRMVSRSIFFASLHRRSRS